MKLVPLLIFISFLARGEVFHFPPGDARAGKLTREQFEEVGRSFLVHAWFPDYQAAGPHIVPRFDWQSPHFMAGTQLENNLFTLHLAGAIGRLPEMDPLGLAFVLCHELGHLRGGEPRQRVHAEWASLEGQSDYWGAGVCLRKWLQLDAGLFHSVPLHPEALALCRFDLVCSQIVTAGEVFFRAAAPWVSLPSASLSTPERTRVERTNEFYPSPQCRLDTVVAAALKKPRPRCWYR